MVVSFVCDDLEVCFFHSFKESLAQYLISISTRFVHGFLRINGLDRQKVDLGFQFRSSEEQITVSWYKTFVLPNFMILCKREVPTRFWSWRKRKFAINKVVSLVCVDLEYCLLSNWSTSLTILFKFQLVDTSIGSCTHKRQTKSWSYIIRLIFLEVREKLAFP